MNIPDNHEAHLFVEDHRQAAWDRKCAAYPQCQCCGHSLLRCSTYRRTGNVYICGDCDAISEIGNTDELEV